MAISFPGDLRYVPTDRAWTAAHTGYSEVVWDGTYHETQDEWTGSHASYEDRYEPGPVETEPEIPDFRTLWAAAHPRNLDDAVVTGSLSGGSLHLTLERDSNPGEHALPLATTAVQVSVLGTDVSMLQVFPDISPTLDVSLDGVPPGIHTVEVKAYANGRVVGVTTFTVRVDAPPPRAEAAAEPEAPAPAEPDEAAPAFLIAPRAPQGPGPERAPAVPAASLPPEREPGPAEGEGRPGEPAPRAASAPPPAVLPDLEIANPAEDSYTPGQAMAAGQGIAARQAWAVDEDGGGVAALRASLESGTDDRGGRRPRP